MNIFDLRNFISANSVELEGSSIPFYEYKVPNSSYSIRLAKGRYYNNVIVFMHKDKYIHIINIRYEESKVKELEKLSEECNDIKEVMDYYLGKYIKNKRVESEEQKKLDSFMLKGE